jgi:putative ABC transport system ATP-binding protein
MDVMFELQRQRGATLLLVTHDATLAKRAGRTVQVLDGRVNADAGRLAETVG